MSKLHEHFPTADALLDQTPETLAPILLRIVAAQRQSAGFWPPSVTQVTVGSGMAAESQHAYPYHKQQQVDALVNETLERLRREGMILPAAGINGANGWMVLSRDGEAALETPDGFDRILALRSFPKTLLHPSIASDVSAALQRGDFSTAVRDALTAVEIAVRQAGCYTDDDYGVDLMRKAFNSDSGPLADMSLPERERKGYEHMFAGAIAALKNPHSHRKLTISDMQVALDQVLFASYLLRIVDSRRSQASG
jgi:uncharacterized protein (TIGR02391 family)